MKPYTLYCGDCREVMTRLAELGVKVNLTVTSPPYDNLRTYDKSCDWNYELFKGTADGLYSITADGGVVVWIVSDSMVKGSESGSSFQQALYFMDAGFKLHDTMIYEKHNPTPNTGNGVRYQQCFEYMFVFSKGKPAVHNILKEPRRNTCNDKRTQRIKRTNRNKDGEFGSEKLYLVNEQVPRRNIWIYKVGLYNTTNDKEAFVHPAIFPEQLAKDHILSWSNPNDLVFDPFMGSGTTGKMAVINGRRFIGVEKVAKYYFLSESRIRWYSVNLSDIVGK